MLGRMRSVVWVMIIFWLTFMGFSWFVGKLYLPFMESIFFGANVPVLAAVIIWLIVVFLLALMLVLFRDILQGIFYRELTKLDENKKSASSNTGLDG